MLTLAICKSAFCPTLPTLPMAACFQMGGKFSFQTHSFSYCCKAYAPAGSRTRAQAWEACMLPLHYRRHDTSQETRQWLLAIAPLPSLLSSLPTNTALQPNIRQRGDSNPCGQSSMDFLVHLLGHSDSLSCLFQPPTFMKRFTHPAPMAIFLGFTHLWANHSHPREIFLY